MTVDGDDITTGELARNLSGLRSELSSWRSELQSTLAGFVTMQLYQSEMTTIRAEVARIEAESEAGRNELRKDLNDEKEARLRWKLAFFTALVAPVMVALIVGALVIRSVG